MGKIPRVFSQTPEYEMLVAAVAKVPLIAEMARNEYKVLQLTKEELQRCYQLCMQNTSEEMIWVGSGRDTRYTDKERV